MFRGGLLGFRGFYNLVLLLIQVIMQFYLGAAVSLDLSRLATTLNRLERSIKSGIYTQSLRRQDKLRILVGAFLTQGKASSIPIVFSWGDSISPDGFLPSILLLLVIIVAVAIVVTVILVVVVVGEGWANEFHRSFTLSDVPIGIISICHGSSLCFKSCENTTLNKKVKRETNIELAASESFKDVHHLDTDVKSVVQLEQEQPIVLDYVSLPEYVSSAKHTSSTLAAFYATLIWKSDIYACDGIGVGQNEYRSITHGVGIILKEKRPLVRGKDHFVDDTLGKCCVKINDLKDRERHEMWLLLDLIVLTLITTQSEKESTLAYYHRIHGNKWAEIAKHLPGRLVLPTELADGFSLEKMSSPLGVLVIFESRSEALVQI
ncbi:C2 domain-containing protein-like protein isoform X2 [Tanacetum coccineum]|uniref:C2 domain-containing protein-like protein isoform X2 n=1 Tax=Tanacetum coccineum TaxID=301880 RepID=A0ABQ5E1M3_9ASTR